MTTYSSAIIPSPDEAFPFIAVITDQSGTVIGEIPVRTEADGAAIIEEALKELEARGWEGQKDS
jgi:hypothetical protein